MQDIIVPTESVDTDAAPPEAREICQNCQTALRGPFCHHCGQDAHIHRSLAEIGHDFLHGVLHFEGRLWTSLPLLLRRPGELTRRYIHGERRRFMSPIGLFLLAVFLTYAVFSLVGSRGAEVMVATPDAVADTVGADLGLPNASGTPSRAPDASTATAVAAKNVSQYVDLGHDALNERVAEIEKNPKLMLFKLQANAYKFAWGLIPLSTLVMWLLFPFSRRFRLYDHFVFVTYSISFVLFVSVLLRLISLTPLASIGLFAAVLAIPVHNFAQLRGAYDLSVGGALWRTIALLILSLFVALGFLAALVLTGASDL
jgi:hypothetical protein